MTWHVKGETVRERTLYLTWEEGRGRWRREGGLRKLWEKHQHRRESHNLWAGIYTIYIKFAYMNFWKYNGWVRKCKGALGQYTKHKISETSPSGYWDRWAKQVVENTGETTKIYLEFSVKPNINTPWRFRFGDWSYVSAAGNLDEFILL